MSRRKQAAIQAAAQTAHELATAAPEQKKHGWRQRWLHSSTGLAVVGVSCLLALGVIGASVSRTANFSVANGGQSSSSDLFSANPTGAPAAAPLPSPSPTPQLSKEYVYAGGRMLAVEDANAATSSYQPADLVVWRISTGYWYVRDSTDGTFNTNQFGGVATDSPAPADFDGDGLTDFCVFRKDAPAAGLATWYFQYHSQIGTGAYQSLQFGLNTD